MNEQTACEQLPSKKNYVYKKRAGSEDVVIKVFTAQDRFKTEKQMGEMLENSGLLTPRSLYVNEASLIIMYSYVNSSPVVDLIETLELTKAEEIIEKICAWLVDFYSITLKTMGCQYILGDIHLRNFLYEEATNQVYGLDFEECRPGRIETDAARLFVFILHYEPAFTPRKKALAAGFWESLNALLVLDEKFFHQEIERETKELLERRKNRSMPFINTNGVKINETK